MSEATTAAGRLAELAAWDERLDGARRREAELQAEFESRRRELTDLRLRRLEYERAVGGGGERRDEAFERRADEELGSPFVAEIEHQDFPDHVALVDRRVEARLEGAREARETVSRERSHWCAVHEEELAAELMPRLEAEDATVAEALAPLRSALAGFEAAHREALRVMTMAGADTPPNPYRDLARELARLRRAG